jgi:hypothetical protein
VAKNKKEYSSRENELKAICAFVKKSKIELSGFMIKFYVTHRYDPLRENYPLEKEIIIKTELNVFYCVEGGDDIFFNNSPQERLKEEVQPILFKDFDH